MQVPDSVVVRHLGGQAETNRFAIESLLKGTMPAVRPTLAVPSQLGCSLPGVTPCPCCCKRSALRYGQQPAQALKRFEQTAVSESEKIEENIEQLLAGFSLDGPLAYSVTLDVMPPVAWRQPYKGIRVRRSCLPRRA